MSNWRREMERRMVRRGYETARGSSRELAALLGLGGPRRPQPSKADLKAQAKAALESGVPIKRLPPKPHQ